MRRMRDMDFNEPKVTELRAALPELPVDDEGPVFREPWQAQAFAMTLALHERGVFTWKEWAQALSVAIDDAQLARHPGQGDTYYVHWLGALERLTAQKGCVDIEALARRRVEWDEAARATPHGKPIILGRAHAPSVATLDACRAAIYRIHAQPDIDMKIGVANCEVASLLAMHGVESAVFVAAFDPSGDLLTSVENEARQDRLTACVRQLGLHALPGEDIHPVNGLQSRASLFVLGATRDIANALMREFQQSAVVYIDRAGVPELLPHPEHR